MTGLVLLAAGSSSRMGVPKQTLKYNQVSLLKHAVNTAVASSCSPIIVVLGANVEQTQPELDGQSVQIVHNDQWQEGMASSIRCGINALQEYSKSTNQVLLMVCDQPYVTSALLDELITTKSQTGKGIIACAYKNTLGTPAIFDHKYFEDLLALQGQQGAKKLFTQYADDVVNFAFPEGNIDIDTPADYEALRVNTNNQ